MRWKHGTCKVIVFGMIAAQALTRHGLQVMQSRLHRLGRDHLWLTIRIVATVGRHSRRKLPVHGWSSSNVGSFWVLEDTATACSHQSSRSFGVSGTERRTSWRQGSSDHRLNRVAARIAVGLRGAEVVGWPADLNRRRNTLAPSSRRISGGGMMSCETG